ncbi:hypothetical protein V2J09_019084 [Rumex salicifolius]
MAIDTNDIKILVYSSIEILMKSCWQCLKDHPIISALLLVFLSFYIFLPSLFYLLFYTSPLVICTIILLQGHFQFSHQNIRTDKPEHQSSHGESGASSRKLRPSIQAAMSRRTFKKRTCEELGTILMEDLKVDFIIRSFSDDIPMKLREEKASIGSDYSKKNGEAVKIGGCQVRKLDAESQKDDKFKANSPQEMEKSKPVVEWNEEDQKNDMDLGSSEMERNKRLENLIAKRRARKMFNMIPHRINPLSSVANDFQGGHLIPINTERNSDNEGGQPGSAPSVLGPTNPFDLPYDPSEEKPVLTGDGFAEEILITQPKDMHYCRHESFTYGPSFFTDYFDDLHSKSRVSVFTNPIASTRPGLPRSRRYSVKLKNMQSNRHEEDVSPNGEYADTILLESRDSTKEQEPLDTEQEERQSKISAMESTEMNQDLIDDDNDETSSLSSFETTADIAKASADVTVAVKNENFRNSVKKVLAVIQKNRVSAYDNEDCSPSPAHRTKMEERALYTRPSHIPSYSMASDMQVEVSEEPNSPTDVESLVFDRDEDGDVYEDEDEDSQGTSRGSVELEEQETRSRTEADCSEESLNNFDDFNVESSRAEDHMVGSASTSTEQNIDTYIHLPSSNEPTVQNPNHSSQDPNLPSPRSVLQETITMEDEDESMNTHSSMSPSLADNRGSIDVGSRPSPKSVLPETITVHELAVPSWEDHQTETPDEEASTSLEKD